MSLRSIRITLLLIFSITFIKISFSQIDALSKVKDSNTVIKSKNDIHLEDYYDLTKYNEMELKDVALQMYNIGNYYLKNRDYKIAFKYFYKSGDIFLYINDSLRNSICLFSIGLCLEKEEKYFESIEYYDKAIEVLKIQMPDTSFVNSYIYFGNAYYNIKNFQKALLFFNKANNYYKIVRPNYSDVYIKYMLAECHNELCQFDNALREYLELIDSTSDYNKIIILEKIASIYSTFGNFQESLRIHKITAKYYIEHNQMLYYAYSLVAISSCYIEENNEPLKQLGLIFLDSAFKVFNNLKDEKGLNSCLSVLSRFYENNNSLDSAIYLYKKLFNLYGTGNYWWYNNIGFLYSLKNQYDSSLYYHNLAFKEINNNKLNDIHRIYNNSNFGFTYYKKGEFEKSESYLKNALNLLENITVNMSDTKSQEYISEKSSFLYNTYFEVSYITNQLEKAFTISEKNKARLLLQNIQESKINYFSDADTVLVDKNLRLEYEINEISNEVNKRTKDNDETKLINTRDSLYQLKELIVSQLKKSSPLYSTIRKTTPISVVEIQNYLDENTALLYYKEGIDKFHLIILTNTELKIIQLDSISCIKNKVFGLISQIKKVKHYFTDSFISKIIELSKILLSPAENLILSKKKLLIIPDGILFYLPFEVLIARDLNEEEKNKMKSGEKFSLPYILMDYDITYLPSATMINIFKIYDKLLPSKDLICFADPVFVLEYESNINNKKSTNDSAYFLLRSGEVYKNLIRLPETGIEVDSIANLFNPENIKIYKRENANEDNLKKEDLSKYKYIHLATHCIIDNEKPQYSKIALSFDVNSNEDGFLEVREIFGLKLNADMVVLSACETGLGKEIKGEGILGFTRAFFVAGAKNIVVSLWSVYDESTKNFMIDFYNGIIIGKSKSKALRDAKLEMINSSKFFSPYYWAPFVLYGENK